jgi:SAM-dependent methyltransferase
MGEYDPAHFARLFAIEQRHAWFRARREMIGQLAADVTRDLPAGYRVLEVGCGTGSVLQELERVCARGQVIGMDKFAEGLDFARQRTSCPLVVGDAHDPPFGAEFAVVGLFDVLEHLAEDESVLTRMGELLLPGGALLLTVPADPSLWSYFDESAHHQRRYTLPDLQAKLRRAGFEVEYITHFMRALGFVMPAYRRAVPFLGGTRETRAELRVIPGANDVLYWLLKSDAHAIRRRRQLTRGTSILAIVRRPAA